MINVSPLNAIYGDDIPSDLQSALKQLESRLTEQKDFVKQVTIMPNCSVDYDRTIHLQKTLSADIQFVLQGVLVTVKPEYKLGFEDAIWFHPEMAKGRSVYNIEKSLDKSAFDEIKEIHHVDGQYDKENPAALSPFHCDVGEYSEVSIDDMGLQTEKKQLIINVSQEALTYSLWTQYLMTGEKVGNVYKNWTEMDMGNGKSIMDTSAYVRDLIAQKIMGCTLHTAMERKNYSDEVNALYSDGSLVYFANHCVKTPKEEGAKILVHLSALSGYELYNVKSDELFTPSNIGLSSKNFNWDDMTSAQRSRIFSDCIWEGNEGFNTYVLKPPGMKVSEKKMFEANFSLFNSTKFRMKVAKFSSQPVRDFMEIGRLLELTPLSTHLEGTEVEGAVNMRSGKEIDIPLSLDYAPFESLLKNFEKLSEEYPDFKLFNEKLVKGGYIKIPREIIDKLN
jgi:hypothetical protein